MVFTTIMWPFILPIPVGSSLRLLYALIDQSTDITFHQCICYFKSFCSLYAFRILLFVFTLALPNIISSVRASGFLLLFWINKDCRFLNPLGFQSLKMLYALSRQWCALSVDIRNIQFHYCSYINGPNIMLYVGNFSKETLYVYYLKFRLLFANVCGGLVVLLLAISSVIHMLVISIDLCRYRLVQVLQLFEHLAVRFLAIVNSCHLGVKQWYIQANYGILHFRRIDASAPGSLLFLPPPVPMILLMQYLHRPILSGLIMQPCLVSIPCELGFG